MAVRNWIRAGSAGLLTVAGLLAALAALIWVIAPGHLSLSLLGIGFGLGIVLIIVIAILGFIGVRSPIRPAL